MGYTGLFCQGWYSQNLGGGNDIWFLQTDTMSLAARVLNELNEYAIDIEFHHLVYVLNV